MTFSHRRRQLLQVATCSTVPVSLFLNAQEAYPSKAIKIVVPLPAGGVADASVRILVDQLQAQINQSVVIDNKPGGIFQIGVQAVSQAAADGYTLLHLNSSMVAAQAALKRYDLLKQLSPVCLLGTTDGILVSSLAAPFKTTQELITWARANPGKLNYGSSGPGSLEHLFMETFAKKQGFTATHIPFKGGPETMTALAQNEIQVSATAFPLMFQFGQKVRPLGMLVDKRSTQMPDISTTKEQGLELPTLQYWGGLAVPAGTPKSVIDTLQRHFATVIGSSVTKGKFTPLGMTALMASADEFSKMIADDLRWMTVAVKDADLKLN